MDDGGELRDRTDQAGPRPGDGATAVTWHEIKSRFVDDPAGAIAAAEGLVRQAVDDKVRALQAEAAALCARDRGEEEEASTETLRTRLIRYQGYCERLGGSSVH
jgi:molybdopterin synthase catalytic subunit